jgi:hypothetical protein
MVSFCNQSVKNIKLTQSYSMAGQTCQTNTLYHTKGATVAGLYVSCQTSPAKSIYYEPPPPKKFNVGPIVGEVVGITLIIVILLSGIFFFLRRRVQSAKAYEYNLDDRSPRKRDAEADMEPPPIPVSYRPK